MGMPQMSRSRVRGMHEQTLDSVHRYVYDVVMKRRELERTLKRLGWVFLRHGASHDVWAGPDGRQEAIPRHAEITERLARAIVRRARQSKEDEQ